MSDHWTHPDASVRELIEQAHIEGLSKGLAAVNDVHRYALLTLGSISVERRGMAEDVLSLIAKATDSGPVYETGPAQTTRGQS